MIGILRDERRIERMSARSSKAVLIERMQGREDKKGEYTISRVEKCR